MLALTLRHRREGFCNAGLQDVAYERRRPVEVCIDAGGAREPAIDPDDI
jgi:hypothetical protein